jgi:hypothetical protein
VKGLRVAGIGQIGATDEHLETTYLDRVNRRHAKPPIEPKGADVPLFAGQSLQSIFCF